MLIKVQMKILFLLFSIIFWGCTAQNFVPTRPLQKGENEIRLSLNYSFNSYEFGGFQISNITGLTDNDIIGVSFLGILPNNISYAHYWGIDNIYHNVQFHLNDLFALGYNPTYEIDYGFTSFHNRTFNSFKFGLGLYHISLLHLFVGRSVAHSKIVPVIGYRLQHNEFNFDAQIIYGMTKYFIKYYTDGYLSFKDSKNNSQTKTFHSNEIDSIFKFDDEFGNGLKVALKTKDTLIISETTPYYYDSFFSIQPERIRKSYLATKNHKNYYIFEDNFYSQPIILELDINKVFESYNNTGELIFNEETNLSELKIKHNYRIWDDIFFSLGWIRYK